MAVYYGVVRDNRIELEGAARLADGTRVEVRAPAAAPSDIAATENVARARLCAAGLLSSASYTSDDADEEEFEPIPVQGELLSEQVIRERR